MHSELAAALDLLALLALDPKAGPLIGLLICAGWIDLRTRKIPNALVLFGIVFALIANGLFPAYAHENGWLNAAIGLAVGFFCFLPFYLVRAMGAGDVKLMAMVGAFVGPVGALHAVLASMIAGGLLAIATMLLARASTQVLRNVMLTLRSATLAPQLGLHAFEAPSSGPRSRFALPYGLAIAVGTIVSLVLKQLALI